MAELVGLHPPELEGEDEDVDSSQAGDEEWAVEPDHLAHHAGDGGLDLDRVATSRIQK